MTSKNIVQSIQHHDFCNHQILKSLHDHMKNFFAEKFFITLHDFAAFLSNIIVFFQLMLWSSYKNNFNFNIISSQLSSQFSYKVNSSLNDFQRLKVASYKNISDAQTSQTSSSLNSDIVSFEHHICQTVSMISDF